MTMTWKLTENEGQRSCSDAGRDVINGCVCWTAEHAIQIRFCV